MHKQKVVILGGGVGGIVTANHLAKLIPQENEIVLIEKNRVHSFAASYLWLMVNKRKVAATKNRFFTFFSQSLRANRPGI